MSNVTQIIPRLSPYRPSRSHLHRVLTHTVANPPPQPFYPFTSFLPHVHREAKGPLPVPRVRVGTTKEGRWAEGGVGGFWAYGGEKAGRWNFTPVIKATTPLIQQRHYSTASTTNDTTAPSATFETTHIPDVSHYKRSTSDKHLDRTFAYFMVGSAGFLSAIAAKNTVHDFLATLSASADVLALGKIEVDLSSIPEGKNVVVKWRGKPIFIRHRTPAEISEATQLDVSVLRHPETDAERAKVPQWLVMLGVCTHLGCVPIGEAGDYNGWYCPCHGSHYDVSGRIRKGPAPLNLEIPPYSFSPEGDKLVLGG